ncbi:zinc transporter ZupT [Wansuia hejianensis]|uniref:Zinc transporter ZupT n=1 Tax=Wansuia hejianensis TaxID=2763667 RepID=A0A926IN22_9FIRM|nr:zinc transporter ZupT [Wansuia hejianensis]MBC8590248.1 zinc transporter ZupT [Wansuia hejianensis]
MEKSNLILSLGLTLIVGLSMGLGSLLSFFIKGNNKRFLALSLSFSAGIMIYISFMEILPEGIELIEAHKGHETGHILALTSFFGGMILTALLEKLVHKIGGDEHHDHGHDHIHGEHLSNLGIMSAIAIGIHNLPEGLALFTTGLKDITMAIPIAAAILLHNIPLSIAISVPIYYSTKSKRKAFFYTLLVGLCQPIGAILGYLVLSSFFDDVLFGILFSMISGIMIFVSLDELLPTSQKYEDHHISVYGAIAGMMVMAISLVLFGHSH